MRVLGIALLLIHALGTGCAKKGADLVYTNGRIFTGNPEQPWAEAVAVSRGKFVHVGSNDKTRAFIGTQTQEHDLRDRFVLPLVRDLDRAPYVLEPPDRVILVEPITEERFHEYARLQRPNRTGSIVAGNHADLLVLSEDPFRVSSPDLRIVETVIRGERVTQEP